VNLLVAVGESSNVTRFDGTTGAFIDDFVTSFDGDLFGPDRLAFGPDDNLYVGSSITDEILRYDNTTGVFIDEFVFSGHSADGLQFKLYHRQCSTL